MMWDGWGWHWLWMLGWWALIIGLIAWAVTRIAPSGPQRGSDARAILDERYARGELDDDEYRRRRTELGR